MAATSPDLVDPLEWLGEPGSAIAELAFGSAHARGTPDNSRTRHLALLPTDALELDLDDPVQRQFGDYELLELIGEGGMGVVYRARQASLDREVAVKLLAAGPWASQEFVERFRREAQNAARMQHPNIVAIYEVGSTEELHFFSMQLIRGPSLAGELKRIGAMPAARAAQLLRTIAEAVDYAHRLGVLHLDLKPANVLIDEIGTPHVADFGLARRLDQSLAADTIEVSGTPSYMAPEQATAGVGKITAATDIWGLGAILYELVTGKPPFAAATVQATLELVVEGTVRSPRQRVPGLPLDLDAIIMRCMARDVAARYGSARELAEDLARFGEGRAVRARPLNTAQRTLRWARREPKLAATALLALTSLLAGLAATTQQWQRATRNATLAQSNADVARHTLWASRSASMKRQIVDGQAYPALANAVANLREMEVDGDRDDAAIERLRIGTMLANAPRLIAVIPVADAQITALAMAPDAKTLAAAVYDESAIHLIDTASGKERWRVKVDVNSFGMLGLNRAALELHFSGDGHRLVGHPNIGVVGGAASMLYPHYIDGVMIDVDAGKEIEPPPAFADFLAVSYADDGRYALLFDRHGGVQRWRTQPWAADGDLVRLDGILGPAQMGPLQGEALLTDDGATTVLVGDANLTFRSFDAQHMRPHRVLRLTTAQDRATAWALRHDGRQLAIGTTAGQLALWDLDTGATTWLRSRLNGWIPRLHFSADDSRLAAVSNEPNELRVFDARNLDAVARPVTLATHDDPGTPNDFDFGPDASTVLTRHWATDATVWRLSEPGFPLQAPTVAAPPMVASSARFALSSDTRSHLMATGDNGQAKLWRMQWSPLSDQVGAPLVSDTLRFDGRHRVFVDGNRARVFDVVAEHAVGVPIELPEAPTFAGLDADGAHMIAIAGRELSCRAWQDGRPCWPSIALPDSPLRLSLAANASLLAVSTGSNETGVLVEHVHLIDMATGRPRGEPIDLRGPLGALRLSDDGQRLLTFEHRNVLDKDSNLVRVVDTGQARIAQNLLHEGEPRAQIIDARFADDGSIWSLSGSTDADDGAMPALWHWDANGKLLGKRLAEDLIELGEFGLLPLPHGRGVIEMGAANLFDATGKAKALAVPHANNRVNVGAVSPDGKLLALGTLDGVTLHVIDRDERLAPDIKLPLPNHDSVQQLAFAPDGSRLLGRSMAGHWFQWRIVADARPVTEIEQDIHRRDLTDLGLNDQRKSAPAPSEALRRQLRAEDPGPEPADATAAVPSTANAPAPDARYGVLDLDPIANVEPRAPMNHAARMPPQPQSLPTLPRGLQRYDGVDFLLGRAVQLSGAPRNLINTEFPAHSPPLRIAAQRIGAIDALVFQYVPLAGAAGVVKLHYADGGERALPILDGRDTRSHFDEDTNKQGRRRVGWLGNYATAIHGFGLADRGDAAMTPSYVVRLENPEPSRSVTAISLEAPPTASPALLFLALTVEPVPASLK